MPAHGAEGGQHATVATPSVRLIDALSSSRDLLLSTSSLLFFPSYPLPRRSLGFLRFWSRGEMEGKNPSFAEETSPPKLDPLSSIPSPSSLAEGKDSSQCGKPTEMGTGESGSEGQSSNGDEMEPLDEIPNCSASQSQAEDNINNGPVMLCDVPEPCLMTSSVHYGGRDDFIPEFTSSHKKDQDDDSNESNVAVRGEWWQGSLYY